MKQKHFLGVAVLMIMLGALLLAWPSTGHAYTISSVTVTWSGAIADPTFCPAGSCSFNVWTYTITLAPGETALLSQTSGYNFDTSDPCIGIATCTDPTITIVTDLGISTYIDTANILNYPAGVGLDCSPPGAGCPPLETNEYTSYAVTSGPDLGILQVGYADDAHLQSPHTACTDAGANCRPDPFTGGGGANQFQANPAAGGCLGSVSPCFDAGVLRLTAAVVPVPATLVLLGAGFMGLAAWGSRRSNRKR